MPWTIRGAGQDLGFEVASGELGQLVTAGARGTVRDQLRSRRGAQRDTGTQPGACGAARCDPAPAHDHATNRVTRRKTEPQAHDP